MSGLEAGRAVLRVVDGTAAPQTARTFGTTTTASSSFVEYPGMPVYPPTYHQKDITLFQFALEADAQCLGQLVDRLLNPGAGSRPFQALGRWVLLQSGYIAGNTSDAPWSSFGTGAETSISLLIPVVRWNGWGGPGTKPVDVGFFAPWVFVDHPLSVIAGREVLGMAKQLAVFDPPATLDDVTMSTMVVDRLSPESPVIQAPLVNIRPRGPASSDEGSRSLHGPDVIDRAIASVVGGGLSSLSRVGGLIRTLFGRPRVRFFSLRQLRDGKVPTRAAFQEVTQASMALGKLSFRRPRSRHTIELVEHASHPIARELGLARGPLTPVAELEVHVTDATLEREYDD